MEKLLRLAPAPVALVALGLALVGGGSAVAGSLITSAQIKDHTIKMVDLNNHTVQQLQGQTGDTGPAGPQGPQGPQGDAGPAGTARGWALLKPDGTVMYHHGTFDNLVVTHPSTGVYCLGAASGTSIGLGNYDPVLATAHGQDFAKVVATVNTEYGSTCNPYGGHGVFTTNLAGTATDAYVVVALM